jgi:hypothetical protein
MLDEQFRKQRASLVRELAERADPFVRQRLLELATSYEKAERRPTRIATPTDLKLSRQDTQASER